MYRSGATEGEDRVRARVLTALDRVDAGRVGHVLVDDLMNAPGGRENVEPERLGDLSSDRLAGRVDIQTHLAAEEIVRVEVTEDEVGIGDGWRRPATPVASRSRHCARRVRPDLE